MRPSLRANGRDFAGWSAKFSPFPRFGAEEPQKSKNSSGQPLKPSRGWLSFIRQNFFRGMSYTAMISSLAGGFALAVASLLPGNPSKQEKTEAMTSISSSEELQGSPLGTYDHSAKIPIVQVKAEGELLQDLESLKRLLNKLGLVTMSVGIGAGCLSDLGVGMKHKQPTLVLANMIFLAASPFFINESAMARGIFLFLLGPCYAGGANVVRNKYQKPPPKNPKKCDISLSNLPQMIRHIASDHQAVLASTQKTLPEIKAMVKDVLQIVKAMSRGQKVSIQPSYDRTLVGALCHYTGGSILMASGGHPGVALVGSVIATMGGLSMDLVWLGVGTQRNDKTGTALKWGVPIQLAGKCLMFTNLGYAMEQIGQGTLYLIAAELNQPTDETESEKPHAEDSKDNNPPKPLM